jgi:hypothetical protein
MKKIILAVGVLLLMPIFSVQAADPTSVRATQTTATYKVPPMARCAPYFATATMYIVLDGTWNDIAAQRELEIYPTPDCSGAEPFAKLTAADIEPNTNVKSGWTVDGDVAVGFTANSCQSYYAKFVTKDNDGVTVTVHGQRKVVAKKEKVTRAEAEQATDAPLNACMPLTVTRDTPNAFILMHGVER